MKLKKIFASLLSLGMILSPLSIQADEIVAVASDNSAYTSYKGAWAAAKTGLKITMMEDWNLGARLIVPEGVSVVIEMNGCKITRNLEGSSDGNGEVILLKENSSLTLTGNNYKDTQFTFKGYDKSENLTDLTLVSGGLVTGGASLNGAGGIHMDKGSQLDLENVAVAGNKTTIGLVRNGGGINMNDDNCKLTMTNAIVGYNQADKGGGIYVAGENTYITMKGSSICNNYAYDDGGGIYSNKDATYITMNEGSYISDNYSSGEGGGIFLDNPYCQVLSADGKAKIMNNTAEFNGGGICYGSSSRGDTQIVENVTFDSNVSENKGGAIFADQNNLTIKDCTFERNSADGYGGAIFLNADKVYVTNCCIQINKAGEAGAGIYVPNTRDLYISGKMIVEYNTRTDSTKDDIFLSKVWFTDAYISGTPDEGSRVGIRCDDERQVGINQTEDNGSFFSDVDGFKITYKDGNLYKESGSVLGSIFGNANLGAAIVVIVGITAVGVVILIFNKKKNHGKA